MQDKHLIQAGPIKVLKTSHPEVRKLKRQGFEASLHGNKVWRSCYVLMDFLDQQKCLKPKQKIMDIGCGWGVMSMFLAKAYDAEVTGIDADENLKPYFELHATINKVDAHFENKKFQQVTGKDLENFDTLIGTDICFWDELTPVIYNLIRRALRAGVKQVLIGDPGRPPFWALAALCEEKLGAKVIEHSIDAPIKTRKHILWVKA